MPEEGIDLSPPSQLLISFEIAHLSTLFVSEGVTKFWLTGGEPTPLASFRQNGLRELCVATNGIFLPRMLDPMLEAGLTGINLSMDTLDPFQFETMTRKTSKGLEGVMKSIDRILQMKELQVNDDRITVDRELLDLIEYAVKRKKAKHAGMTELASMNRPLIFIGV
ncbi:molybdenum cofactor biosynthesis protein A, putative [Talaromyces stipitatus ATCC 10500]|uniref:Molybdenum cofactor biosynthesis protein A, putative n=1 Tax=Talaromyces stipitatus (strain ATCC 10500 / CBS 375.48 / QM 6759 / NRRL 1006) TaxID=441959 RepID=B8M7R8_TALSN|nr:molybdenum cofactor biosynthesis protein A, putative [Talaromyces stipitatus ATCC 10500]EED19797.1 molybdenum cofactor biosynthesis protein A, putative [Talaromyces stipitatus ATCC 10500]